MGTKHIQIRNKLPFEVLDDKSKMPSFDYYIEEAKQQLVQTVDSYKTVFGKSYVDQILLVPEQYRDLVWFLFPSQVLTEIRQSQPDG